MKVDWPSKVKKKKMSCDQVIMPGVWIMQVQ